MRNVLPSPPPFLHYFVAYFLTDTFFVLTNNQMDPTKVIVGTTGSLYDHPRFFSMIERTKKFPNPYYHEIPVRVLKKGNPEVSKVRVLLDEYCPGSMHLPAGLSYAPYDPQTPYTVMHKKKPRIESSEETIVIESSDDDDDEVEEVVVPPVVVAPVVVEVPVVAPVVVEVPIAPVVVEVHVAPVVVEVPIAPVVVEVPVVVVPPAVVVPPLPPRPHKVVAIGKITAMAPKRRVVKQ
jgi:hypothetical protein